MNQTPGDIYGVMAEFLTPEDAAKAAYGVMNRNFVHLDAFGPFPSPELAEAIGFRETRVAPCVLGGGILGGILGYALLYYATVIDYPHNIGGRPINSWPAFIPITFETIVLGASVTGIISLLILNRLPKLAHPAFGAAHFEHATSDRFFLCLLAASEDFSEDKAKEALEPFSPVSVTTVKKEASS